MLTLSGYNNSNGDALHIYVASADDIIVYDTSSVDVTSYLVTNSIIYEVLPPITVTDNHGWVSNIANARAVDWITVNALAFDVTEKFIAMSEARNAGETPIFFARIVDSLTETALTQSDVSSVAYTIYRYGYGSARSGSYGKTPVTNWESLPVNVSDCFIDAPVSNDPRVSFAYNFKFEPNTLTENPFDTAGKYSIEFIITPTSGNRIPVIFEVTLT